MRSELSKKSKYHLSKDRTLELVHFCRQYPEWRQAIADIIATEMYVKPGNGIKSSDIPDPTEQIAEKLEYYRKNMAMIEQTAIEADGTLYEWIVLGITENITYEWLYFKHDLPCSRDTYYSRYRKFLWLLDKKLKYRDGYFGSQKNHPL